MTGLNGPVEVRTLFQKHAELQMAGWSGITVVTVVPDNRRMLWIKHGVARQYGGCMSHRAMHIGLDVISLVIDGDIRYCAGIRAQCRWMFRAISANRVGHRT